MNKNEFDVLLSAYEKKTERKDVLRDEEYLRSLSGEKTRKSLEDKGKIDPATGLITEAGLADLEPYRVHNAVILAAGPGARFIPLSLEQPKGLYEVHGEKLIERQIRQLMEAGITDITVVLGYKKEMFFYLKKQYPVRFIFNDRYNVRNNIESIRRARKIFNRTYLCVCDSYFTGNPFHAYEFESFYAGYYTEKRTNEMYVTVNAENRITGMTKDLPEGRIVLGHTFWTREFSDVFFRLSDEDEPIGIYAYMFWEWMVKDHLSKFPAYYWKQYGAGTIYEFDFFEQLREFDRESAEHAHSRILRNICEVFNCREEDIRDFRTVSEGLTNTSFVFRIGEKDYIYRHPGDGTERIINRANERNSLILARKIGMDPTFIHMDVQEGWKISEYVPEFREPDYADPDDSEKILEVLRRLHASDIRTGYGLLPYEDAEAMEELLIKKDPGSLDQFRGLKEKIRRIYEKTRNDGVGKCFTHGDTYCHNWMITPDDRVILIDWEYAGTSDPGVDVGYYIVDAMYDTDTARQFIRMYLKEKYTPELEFHYLAYTALIAYYWFIWALYRESCGAVMGEALFNWYEMAVRYADYLTPVEIQE